jgi:hypothetical protein
LTSAHGKKLVAKELGLWEGADGYYTVGEYNKNNQQQVGGGGQGRGHTEEEAPASSSTSTPDAPGKETKTKKTTKNRYLLYDGPVSTNSGYR